MLSKSELINNIWIALGTLGWVAIVIMSIVPGTVRPHSGVSGIYEHFIAYVMVAGAFGLGFSTLLHRLLVAIGLTITATSLEFVQMAMPGRMAEIGGALSGLAGAWIGVGLASLKKSRGKNRGKR